MLLASFGDASVQAIAAEVGVSRPTAWRWQLRGDDQDGFRVASSTNVAEFPPGCLTSMFPLHHLYQIWRGSRLTLTASVRLSLAE
ncbi:MAG: hypothetical protein JO278_05220 [Dyella sp.]|nr:hypothetical protein [Dyella sp.]